MKLDSLEVQVVALADSAAQVLEVDTPAVLPASENPAATHSRTDAEELRRIVREELWAARSKRDLLAQITAAETPAPVVDEAEMQYRREIALEELDYLRTQEEFTTGDMNHLMGAIARLDPERRRELFGLLNQAINRGEIKGNL